MRRVCGLLRAKNTFKIDWGQPSGFISDPITEYSGTWDAGPC